MINAVIVGVGLIGGSLGQAWRRAGVARVIGVTRRAETIEEALAAEAIDEGTTDLQQAAARADVLVLCPPVRQIEPLARAALPSLRAGAVITDVGSTKAEICRALWSVLPPHVTFIGGHPMAGSERTGVAAADPYLFENAVYCLTPPAGMEPEAAPMQTLLQLVRATGARPLILEPGVHDLIVAAVSHVPHIAAAALVNAVAAVDSTGIPALQLAAGGFRDTTRVASGASDVWRDICLTNRTAILQMLASLRNALADLEQAVATGDEQRLTELFDRARQVRSTIPARTRGILGTVCELTVILPDRPGAIAGVAGLLARAGINIVDIEIMRVREGEGGTVRIAVADEGAATQAVHILRSNGYTSRRR